MKRQILLPGFWEGWRHTFANVLEDAPLHMHLLNVLIMPTYPAVFCALVCYNTLVKLRTKKSPN